MGRKKSSQEEKRRNKIKSIEKNIEAFRSYVKQNGQVKSGVVYYYNGKKYNLGTCRDTIRRRFDRGELVFDFDNLNECTLYEELIELGIIKNENERDSIENKCERICEWLKKYPRLPVINQVFKNSKKYKMIIEQYSKKYNRSFEDIEREYDARSKDGEYILKRYDFKKKYEKLTDKFQMIINNLKASNIGGRIGYSDEVYLVAKQLGVQPEVVNKIRIIANELEFKIKYDFNEEMIKRSKFPHFIHILKAAYLEGIISDEEDLKIASDIISLDLDSILNGDEENDKYDILFQKICESRENNVKRVLYSRKHIETINQNERYRKIIEEDFMREEGATLDYFAKLYQKTNERVRQWKNKVLDMFSERFDEFTYDLDEWLELENEFIFDYEKEKIRRFKEYVLFGDILFKASKDNTVQEKDEVLELIQSIKEIGEKIQKRKEKANKSEKQLLVEQLLNPKIKGIGKAKAEKIVERLVILGYININYIDMYEIEANSKSTRTLLISDIEDILGNSGRFFGEIEIQNVAVDIINRLNEIGYRKVIEDKEKTSKTEENREDKQKETKGLMLIKQEKLKKNIIDGESALKGILEKTQNMNESDKIGRLVFIYSTLNQMIDLKVLEMIDLDELELEKPTLNILKRRKYMNIKGRVKELIAEEFSSVGDVVHFINEVLEGNPFLLKKINYFGDNKLVDFLFSYCKKIIEWFNIEASPIEQVLSNKEFENDVQEEISKDESQLEGLVKRKKELNSKVKKLKPKVIDANELYNKYMEIIDKKYGKYQIHSKEVSR